MATYRAKLDASKSGLLVQRAQFDIVISNDAMQFVYFAMEKFQFVIGLSSPFIEDFRGSLMS
jgi:hypothetical protein